MEGTVYIQAYEPIQCNGVQVKATGKEKVEWTEERTRCCPGALACSSLCCRQVEDGCEDGHTKYRTEHYEVEFDEKEKFFKSVSYTLSVLALRRVGMLMACVQWIDVWQAPGAVIPAGNWAYR